MRGETSDVIEGEVVEGSGEDIEKSRNITHSPPLSAAASQVSLATSDLTTSDPDLALTSSASSVTSSRPPSSSDVISPDLGLPSVDDYTTETDNLPTQSKPVRSIMAGGGASFMNELNAALRKRSHEPGIDQNKSDEPDEIGDTDIISDRTDSGVNGNESRDPSSSLPIFLGAIKDAKSWSFEGKTQGDNPKYDSEKIPKLDFEPEVGMIVLSHKAAKHKLSVKPKRKHEGRRSRKQIQEVAKDISELKDESNSKTLQHQVIAPPVMPTSLPPTIRSQNQLVDCPQSPLPQTEDGVKTSGVCFAPDINVIDEASIENYSIKHNDFSKEFDPGTNLLGVPPEDGLPSLGPPEGPPSLGFEVEMEDEDYFEEFHLPNSHDNAFVRHKSFRRKVNLAPIDAPDAERIEGLIAAGEFERHGSIRRKLVPEAITDGNKHNRLEKQLSDISSKSGSSDNNDDADISISTDVSGVFARDLKEIQEMLDEESMINIEGDVAPSVSNVQYVNDTNELADENTSVSNSDAHEVSKTHDSPIISETTDIPISDTNGKQAIRRTNTSTPKSNSTSSYTSALLDKDLSSMTEGDSQNIKCEPFLSFEEESMSLDHSTLMKIQECLDFSRTKDMYNLTGRIQDILSPEEMKEVIENADRYKQYINQDILEALNQSLSLSLQEKTMETNTDSGISSPKRTSNEIKNDLRLIFEDGNESTDEGNENETKEHNNNDEENDTGFVFERKRSLRIVNSNSDNEADEVEVEAVFVESDNSPRNMKRLAAPTLDFSATGSEDLEGSHDISVFSNDTPISELDTPFLPNIVLTNTDGYRGDIKQDNDSCSNLLLYDTPSAASEALTPIDLGSYSYTQTPDPDRPGSIDLNGDGSQRKLISVTKDILNSPADGDDISISSVCSEGILHDDTLGSIGDELSGTSDNFGINSPRLSSQGSDGCHHSSPDSQIFEEPPLPPSPYRTCEEDPIPSLPPFIPELSALEESLEDRHWRSVVVGGVWRRIDMKVIAPYRKCLHHGGYMSENNQAIIVFSSCYLPNSSRRDYNYVMDNLFLYVLSTLEQLVADDYVLIYLAGGCPKNSVPSFKWLKRAYQMIDHKLRKNLQALHVVHPTMWVKTIVALTRPFVSSKFYRKLSFINNLTELAQVVPLDQIEIPDTVQQHDVTRKPSILTLLTGSNTAPGRTLS